MHLNLRPDLLLCTTARQAGYSAPSLCLHAIGMIARHFMHVITLRVPQQDAERHALQGGLAYAQGDLEVATASMLDLLHSTDAARAEERALALSNLGCLAARERQHNVALLCFTRALSVSKVSPAINLTLPCHAELTSTPTGSNDPENSDGWVPMCMFRTLTHSQSLDGTCCICV